MRLLELELAGLKNYGEPARIRFSPGLTLLQGPVGSGKSALLDALLLALFGPQRSERERLDAASLRAWAGGESFVGLEVERGRSRYRIRWQLGSEVRASLEQGEGAGWSLVSRDRKRVEEELRKFLRFEDLPTFAAVACVRQGDLERVSRELASVGVATQRALAGAGGVSGEEAVKALERRMLDLLPPPLRPINPRDYEQLQKKKDDLAQRLRAAEEEHRSFETDAERLAELRKTLPELRTRHRELESLLAKEEGRREAARRREEIERALGALDRSLDHLAKVERCLEAAEGELRALALPDGTDAEAAARELDELMRRKALLAGQLARLEREKAPDRPAPRWALACMAAGALAALLGLALGPRDWWWLLVAGAALAFAGIVSFLAARWGREQVLEAERKRLAEEEMNAAEALSRLLARLGASSPEEAGEKLARGGELLSARRERLSERQGILGGEDPEALREKRRALDRALRQARLAEEEFEGFSPSSEEAEKWRAEAQKVREELNEKEAEFLGLEGRVTGLRDRLPSLATLKAELEVVQGRMRQIERSHRACGIALEVMEEARRELEEEYIPRLEERARHYLARIGPAGFLGPRLQGSPLGVRLSAPANPSVEADALSFGEADLLYLSLRLAALEVLEGEDPLPLLLDAPLAHLDSESARKVRALLAERALRGQVVMTSFREDDLEWARELGQAGEVPVAIYRFFSPGKPVELPARAEQGR